MSGTTPGSGFVQLASVGANVVAFSSTGTVDPEGQPLAYLWTFGDLATSTAANPSHTYTSNGSYTARLQVSDGVNSTLSSNLVITVGVPPTVQILTPSSGAFFRACCLRKWCTG